MNWQSSHRERINVDLLLDVLAEHWGVPDRPPPVAADDNVACACRLKVYVEGLRLAACRADTAGFVHTASHFRAYADELLVHLPE